MVDCPVCRASNPPGSRHCVKCHTPFEASDATVALDPASGPRAQGAAAGPTGWSVPIQTRKPHDPEIALAPGTVVGERYEILRALGEGGMGAVYQARDRELDRLIALKVIRPELAGNPDVLRRFKQELILARQVTHKNIIRIFDLGAADGRKFITMEYIDGKDLKSVLREGGKLPPQEAVEIIQQVCRGLEAAHNEGVIHRDLKPHNIMVDPHGRVWVMDFGLARSMDAAGFTRTGALMGTPDYMSPEQVKSEKADGRSDLFTVGIIFYEMLTGTLPFEADSVMAGLLKRVREPAIAPKQVDSSVPQHLNDIVMKCLQIDPAQRYQSAAELLQALGSARDQASVMISMKALQPGALLGTRYRIESVLGEGGMGKVFKAHDNDLDRTVALKLVRPDLVSDENAMQRFKQELLLASRISHKNILRIHDLGEVAGVKFISMTYVDGEDLHERISRTGRLPVDQAVHIARQLCGALEAAHAEGVVHRDLKPRNVLIDKTDTVCVSDFGLAKSLASEASSMTRAGEILGTPRYMSPEQVESKPADNRSDIYALGVILFEMVTGEVPFGGESSVQVMYQHAREQPRNPKVLNPELPDYLCKIILRCLQKDPAQRYQHARDILHDLDAAHAAPDPSRSFAIQIPKLLLSPASRIPAAVIGAVLLLIVLSLSIPSVRRLILRQPEKTATTPDKYIAVLPFRVVGEEPAVKDAAEGVVDAVSAKLFQLKNVYVASASAAEAASKLPSPEKIAQTLGVKLLVQGTVQGAGDKLSVVVSLYDVPRKQRSWSQEFSGSRQDLLTIEGQIYSKLLTTINLKPSSEDLTRNSTRLTSDVDAYQLYLHARTLLHGGQDIKTATTALDLYNQAILKDPGFALAYAGVADASQRMYTLNHDPVWAERARGAAERARDLNDQLPEVHFALGGVYSRTGKTAEAISELKRALELAPNSDEANRRLGFAYLAAGNKEEAVLAYRKAVEVNPYYWLNYSHLGGAYFKFGRNEEALQAFRKVTQLAPDSEAGYANIGAVYHRQGKWNDAVVAFQKALERRPTPNAYSNLGTTYFYLGRYADAAKMFEKAIGPTPDAAAVGNLADAYRWMGQREKANATYDRAIELALKALQVNERDIKTLEYLGLYYAKKGDGKRGQDFMRRARAIDPNDNELMYNEGLIFALSGQKTEALQGLRQAFEHGYSAEEAKNDPELKGLQADPRFDSLLTEFAHKAK